jgi:hypothetical protein
MRFIGVAFVALFATFAMGTPVPGPEAEPKAEAQGGSSVVEPANCCL